MFRLKSSPAKLLSFHQKQARDGRAQLQKVLQLLWKGHMQRAGTAAQHCCSAPQPVLLAEMCVRRESTWHCLQLPVLYACLCSRPACSRGVKTGGRKMHQRLSCISAVCWRTRPGALTLLFSPETPYCFRSLLNSPLQAGQLQNEQVL